MEFRNRPKSNYLLNAEWQELHTLTLHWQSDMVFFGDELRFMDLLIDKYFTTLIDKDHLALTKDVAAKLGEVKVKHEFLEKQVTEHLRHIEKLMINPLATDATNFSGGHVTLEDDLAEFARIFRKLKLDTFQMTERIVKSEKQKHLIRG